MKSLNTSIACAQFLFDEFQNRTSSENQNGGQRQPRSVNRLSYQNLEERDLLAGDVVQSVVVNVNGTTHELTATDNTLTVNAGELVEVQSINFSTDEIDGVFAAEGYVNKLTDLSSPANPDYQDGRFSARDANQAANGGEGSIDGLAEGWNAESGWNRLSLVLVHYTESGPEVTDRFLINVQVGEADFEFDLEALEEVRNQELLVGEDVKIPGVWTNALAGLYHNYAEVDIYHASNPNEIVWAGATVGNAGQGNVISGAFENSREGDGFSQFWNPDTQGEYILKYYLDPEFVVDEVNEENNFHEIRLNVEATVEAAVELEVTNDRFEGDLTSLDVLRNDTGVGELKVTEVTQGQNGAVSINNDGTLAYQPDTNFLGQDKFTYTVADESGATAEGIVNVDVPVSLSVSNDVSVNANETIALEIVTNAPAVYVTGLPTESKLSAGEKTGEGSYLIENQDIAGLLIKVGDSAPAAFDIEVTPVGSDYVAHDELTETISVAVNTVVQNNLEANNNVVIDSFQAQPYSFTFQIRNATAEDRQFEFRIPDANYELTNLQLNGSSEGLSVTYDGSDIVITGTIRAFQSVGGQQPNGFNGELKPTSDKPFVLNGELA